MKYTDAEVARLRGVFIVLLLMIVLCVACVYLLPPWTWFLAAFSLGFVTCMIGYVAQRIVSERLAAENATLTEQNTAAGHRAQNTITQLAEFQRLVSRAKILTDLQGTQLEITRKERDDLKTRFNAMREEVEQINRLQRTRGLTELLEHWEPPKNQEPS